MNLTCFLYPNKIGLRTCCKSGTLLFEGLNIRSDNSIKYVLAFLLKEFCIPFQLKIKWTDKIMNVCFADIFVISFLGLSF